MIELPPNLHQAMMIAAGEVEEAAAAWKAAAARIAEPRPLVRVERPPGIVGPNHPVLIEPASVVALYQHAEKVGVTIVRLAGDGDDDDRWLEVRGTTEEVAAKLGRPVR